MSVYIDPLIPCKRTPRWRYNYSCHLLADSIDELHAFAESIGLKRSWFQMSSSGIPHYDLSPHKRLQAFRSGAIELSGSALAAKLREIRTAINHH